MSGGFTHSLFRFTYTQKHVMRRFENFFTRKAQKRSVIAGNVPFFYNALRLVENKIIFNAITENVYDRSGVGGKNVAYTVP